MRPPIWRLFFTASSRKPGEFSIVFYMRTERHRCRVVPIKKSASTPLKNGRYKQSQQKWIIYWQAPLQSCVVLCPHKRAQNTLIAPFVEPNATVGHTALLIPGCSCLCRQWIMMTMLNTSIISASTMCPCVRHHISGLYVESFLLPPSWGHLSLLLRVSVSSVSLSYRHSWWSPWWFSGNHKRLQCDRQQQIPVITTTAAGR